MPGLTFRRMRFCQWLILVSFVTLVAECECRSAETTVVRELLSPEEWAKLDASTDKALIFLASKQLENGSFQSPMTGQPGITSLCVMAFLSRGHLPGEGALGEKLHRAIDFVLKSQQKDGLIFPLPIEARVWPDNRHKNAIYSHAIAGLMLGEVYGMAKRETSDRIGEAIQKAVKFTIAQQNRHKRHPHDRGGWRYIVMDPGASNDSDLSVTGWQVMFLRSARNSGFEIPVESIDAAMEYVHRAYGPAPGMFTYGHENLRGQYTRGLVGSAIVTLSLGGEHDTDIARAAGEWLLENPLDRYNRVKFHGERFHYSAYYSSQGMFQLGGKYWERFFPPLMRVLIGNQQRDGSWAAEANRDNEMGNVYTTALTVLALTPGYQLLPIYQR